MCVVGRVCAVLALLRNQLNFILPSGHPLAVSELPPTSPYTHVNRESSKAFPKKKDERFRPPPGEFASQKTGNEELISKN